jgi:hypothetical protein
MCCAGVQFVKNDAKINEDESGSLVTIQRENARLVQRIRELEAMHSSSVRRLSLAFTTPRKGGAAAADGKEGGRVDKFGAPLGALFEEDGPGAGAADGESAVDVAGLREIASLALERERELRSQIADLLAKGKLFDEERSRLQSRNESNKMIVKLRDRTIQIVCTAH